MFVIRPAAKSDVEELYKLASKVYFINLPADKKIIKRKIALSEKSFAGQLRSRSQGEFIFVLENRKNHRIVGCSAILAQHGTPQEPHIYFKVLKKKKESRYLNKHVWHQVLRLAFDTKGPTEIGSLVLAPKYRGHPERLGLALSFCRFMYIAAKPRYFRSKILAELMPPLDEHGDSILWEALGRHFTHMSYKEADVLSRKNKEFIQSLFPEGDIYVSMLSKEVQDAIGQVGKATQPVKRMLERIGFHYGDEIDPFDGGPHYWADRKSIKPVKNTKKVKLVSAALKNKTWKKHSGLLMAVSKVDMRIVQGSYYKRGSKIAVRDQELAKVFEEINGRSRIYALEL